jgi:AcrR family transcriptional regulator
MTGRRTQRRLQHQDLSRRQLLDAAEEVFGRHGFHDATLKQVAERAEFSVGSVYSFFASKDDLFHQIFARRGDELLAEMEDAVRDDTAPLVQLHRMVDVELGFFRRHPHFSRLSLRYANVTRLAADTPINRNVTSDPTFANYERATKVQAGVFARGQQDGSLVAGDAEALSRLFSGIVLSYQALDTDGRAGDVLPLDALHALVERAFRA